MAVLLPPAKQQFFDANGAVCAMGTVTLYVPGTTTLKDSWQDSGQSALNTNPIALDAGGYAIIYGNGSYRQLVKDRLGNIVFDRVLDGYTTTPGNRVEYTTYAAMASVSTFPANTSAEVPTTDAGSHTDPVVGGTVLNSGVFRYSTSPAGWQRMFDFPSVGTGPTGAPAANPNYTYVINTLTPGSSGTLTASGVYPNVTLTFGLPGGAAGTSGALSNGIYGDITVSSAGAVLTVTAGTITLAKMANLAAASIMGNNTGAAGVPLALSYAQVKTALGVDNLDNTSDVNKPISTAASNALALKASLASPPITGSPTINGNPIGYLDLVGSSPAGAYTLVLGDRGQTLIGPGPFTIPANASVAFPVRTVITFIATAATTLAITTDTMTLAGSATTGTRTLAANAIATIIKTGAATWLISGTGAS